MSNEITLLYHRGASDALPSASASDFSNDGSPFVWIADPFQCRSEKYLYLAAFRAIP